MGWGCTLHQSSNQMLASSQREVACLLWCPLKLLTANKSTQAQTIWYETDVKDATSMLLLLIPVVRVELLSCAAEQFWSRVGSVGWRVLQSSCVCIGISFYNFCGHSRPQSRISIQKSLSSLAFLYFDAHELYSAFILLSKVSGKANQCFCCFRRNVRGFRSIQFAQCGKSVL